MAAEQDCQPTRGFAERAGSCQSGSSGVGRLMTQLPEMVASLMVQTLLKYLAFTYFNRYALYAIRLCGRCLHFYSMLEMFFKDCATLRLPLLKETFHLLKLES